MNGGFKVVNRVIQSKKPSDFLGLAVKIFLKTGGAFNFKCTGAGVDYISGYDDEGLDLLISMEDIDFIMGQVLK